MVDPEGRREGAPSHIHIEKHEKKAGAWLPWLLLALGLLALLFGLSRCGRDEAAVAPVENSAAMTSAGSAGGAQPATVVAATPNAGAALTGTAGLGTFLAGAEPTPRTFVFEKLNFASADSALRAADAAEVNDVAAVLAQHPSARIRIAGYADARGAEPANMALGKARAESVKAALVAKNIDASRIETVSGGENDPVDTNATASGRFENRRTELIVTAR